MRGQSRPSATAGGRPAASAPRSIEWWLNELHAPGRGPGRRYLIHREGTFRFWSEREFRRAKPWEQSDVIAVA